MKAIILDNVICKHNVAIPASYGKTVHAIVFYNPKDHEIYFWKCTSGGYNWDVGVTYSIMGELYDDNQLQRVKLVSYDRSTPGESKSEQQPVDVFDLIFDTKLTND